jgi:hypothetical protein
MMRRLFSAGLAVIAATAGVLVSAAPSEASAPPAQLHWASSSGLTTFDFGALDAGRRQSLTASFTLENLGGRSTGVLSVAVSGASAFVLTDDCTRNSLSPGRRCAVTVTYRPTSNVGAEGATLTASSKKAAPATFGLTGRAELVPGPQPSPDGATLAIDTTVRRCGLSYCWGGVVGTGLRPGTMVVPLYVDGNLIQLFDVPASGVINELLDFECFRPVGAFYATAITMDGDHIGSATVETPCLSSVP